MLTLSTTTATPSTSKTWSSSFGLSKASAYWKPEQPPPRTATRSAWLVGVGLAAEQLADLLDGLVAEGDCCVGRIRHFTKCSGAACSSGWFSVWQNRRLELERPDGRRLRHDGLPPSELLAERGIETISLYVSVDGEQERESEISDYTAFYERLRASESGATTSQPSIGDFIAVYEPLLAAGKEVVSIHISAGHLRHLRGRRPGSRPADRGRQGRRADPADGLALGGRRDGPLRARRLRRGERGRHAEAVLARAEEAREALKMWFAIDTLEYLRRGGRIGGARAWIGSALKIKPILTLEEEITPVERVRTRARSLERLRGYARQRHESGADGWVVQHIHDEETAAALADDCREIYGCEPVFVSEIGAVLGAHVGPGLLGVGGVPSRSSSRAALAAAAQHRAHADREPDHGGADDQRQL